MQRSRTGIPPLSVPVDKKKEAQLPVPIDTKTFTVKNLFTLKEQTYEILIYAEGIGPNLAQTIAIAERSIGRTMLTLDEAIGIRSNNESNNAFKSELRIGKWGYLHDKNPGKRFSAAILGLFHSDSARSGVIDIGDYWHDAPAPVVILKLLEQTKTKSHEPIDFVKMYEQYLRKG
jgi:hypothetical protein